MRKLIIPIVFMVAAVSLQAQKTDSLKTRITRQWTFSRDFAEEVNSPIDTTFSLYHRNRLADKYSEFNAYPGNYGLPFYQMNFFDRVTDPDKFLYRHFYPIMHTPDNSLFMNTQVPFTEMVFTYAGSREKAEQVFRVRHSQNVTRNLNFGLIFDVIYSLGQYNYQRADNKAFTFFTSYTGEKYKLYAQAGINNLKNLENGGIADISQMETLDTRDIEVNLGGLNNATNVLKNRNLLLIQKFSVNKRSSPVADTLQGTPVKKKFRMTGTFSHILTWDRTKRYYYDENPGVGFYDTSYISTTLTFDSLSTRALKNTIRFDFSTDETRKFRLGGGAGLRNELFRYAQIVPSELSPPSDTADWNESNNVLTGRLFNDIGNKFRWIATGELFLTGYRAGDFEIDGNIIKKFEREKKHAVWKIFGGISSIKPSVWYQRYGSNHFKWENSFLKEFRINAGTSFEYPAWRTSLKFNYAIIDNFTYFGADALPVQHYGGLSVLSLMLKKEFSAWKFHLANDVLIQKSSNSDVADLPLITLRTSGFFEHNFHFGLTDGNLNTQIGVDIMYNTTYNGLSYMPSTGVYHLKPGTPVGNYPYLSAFINLKIKRTRIILTLEHFNAGLTGYNYFLVPSNPLNVMMFRYGFAWTFYD